MAILSSKVHLKWDNTGSQTCSDQTSVMLLLTLVQVPYKYKSTSSFAEACSNQQGLRRRRTCCRAGWLRLSGWPYLPRACGLTGQPVAVGLGNWFFPQLWSCRWYEVPGSWQHRREGTIQPQDHTRHCFEPFHFHMAKLIQCTCLFAGASLFHLPHLWIQGRVSVPRQVWRMQAMPLLLPVCGSCTSWGIRQAGANSNPSAATVRYGEAALLTLKKWGWRGFCWVSTPAKAQLFSRCLT